MTDIAKETVKAPFGQANASSRTVQFKGRPGALELKLDEDAPLLTILSDLRQLLEQNKDLLGQAMLTLNFDERPIDLLQYNEVRRVIERFGHKIKELQVSPGSVESYLEGEFGLSVRLHLPALLLDPKEQKTPSSVELHPVSAEESLPPKQKTRPLQPSVPASSAPPAPAGSSQAPAPKSRAAQPSAPASREKPPTPIPPSQGTTLPFPSLTKAGQADVMRLSPAKPKGPLPEFDTQPESNTPSSHTRPGLVTEVQEPTASGRTALHKVMRTCRAGTFFDVEGDIVLFGDLNPGAEIRATGDIIVFGSLRGIAHAGCKGNKQAIIAAYDLSPTQLRIANQIAIAPAEEHRPRVKTPIEIAYLNTQRQIEVEACLSGKFPSAIRELSL